MIRNPARDVIRRAIASGRPYAVEFPYYQDPQDWDGDVACAKLEHGGRIVLDPDGNPPRGHARIRPDNPAEPFPGSLVDGPIRRGRWHMAGFTPW